MPFGGRALLLTCCDGAERQIPLQLACPIGIKKAFSL